ncbi:MAG: TonB-dependent receptor [Crocinitomicaceae bacterium]|nr:TonB-dependent receptor [Crocinitomicaceae bacterium]
MKILATIPLVLFALLTVAQIEGTIVGEVRDANTDEPLAFAKVFIEGMQLGASTELDGTYRLEVPTGTYTIKVTYQGYNDVKKYNIAVNSGSPQVLNFRMSSMTTELEEVQIVYDKNAMVKTTDMVTPLSVQKLTAEEIKSNPGGNFDVSKVVQTLPGVGGSAGGAQRNDITIRGGAPNENVYYLDGIEIPVLNHFQTQGSSGGAQGILNVSFIEELKLTSSAFDARYDNALASTFVITQRQGNSEKISGNIRSSLTESALTLEGPLGKNKKTDFLASSRLSYLDLLFTLIDLPIRPNFSDYQLKVSHKIDDKSSLTFIGLGAIDRFNFAETRDETLETAFLRRSLPFISQWTYTTGVAYKKRFEGGFYNIAVSRNMFNNQLDQFEDAQNGNENFRNLKLRSQEIENKFRFDYNKYQNGWKYSYGVMGQYVKYNTSIFNRISAGVFDTSGVLIMPPIVINANSAIDFFRYGAFGQLSKNVLKDRLLVSFGLRTDMNTFTTGGNNPLETASPRLSFAYSLSKKWDLTASVGRYFKLPPYTSLGFRDENDVLVNIDAEYIQSNHYVLGTQFLPNDGLRLTLEGFFKTYANYPVSLVNGISLANQGQEFGAIGNEPITSIGDGVTYGAEIFIQQKLVKNIFYVVSYTYVRSLFSGLVNDLIPSAWDAQHLLSGTLGWKFGKKKDWQLGLKYRFAGGVPYTPWDLQASQMNYAVLGNGVLDFDDVNGERLSNFQQLDFRLDKIVNLKKLSFTFYIDIQNLLGFENQSPDYYTFQRKPDDSGFETTDGQPLKPDGSNAVPVILPNSSALVTPTLGIIFEF